MSTFDRFRRLIKKGQKIRDSRMGNYYHRDKMVSDGKGGMIAAVNKVLIPDQNKQMSKYREGPNWIRGNPPDGMFTGKDESDTTFNFKD